MKYSKVAAAVAGSVIAVGVGAPAFADSGAGAAPQMPTSVGAGVDQVLGAQPVQQVAEGSHLDSTLQTVAGTTGGTTAGTTAGTAAGATSSAPPAAADALHGQASPAAVGIDAAAADALRATSLLGGLPLGDWASVIPAAAPAAAE